jgi:hypothetical protein
MSLPIKSFEGEYKWLSNFYSSPVEIEAFGNKHIAKTVEHAYQALKSKNIDDFKEILEAETPGKAKKLGQDIDIRSDWNDIKENIMLELLKQKFNKNPLRQMLLNTKTIKIIEGNTWHDNFWGKCYCGKCENGENKLGELLMKIRGSLSER